MRSDIDPWSEVTNVLRDRGATAEEIRRLDDLVAGISVNTNYGVVADRINGPVAAGNGARASVVRPRRESSRDRGAPPRQRQVDVSFWEKAKSIAGSATSVAQAIELIAKLIKDVV